MASAGMVFFRKGACNLETAAKCLADCGLTAQLNGNRLSVGAKSGPQLVVWFSDREHVQEEAAEIGSGTEHEEALKECSARFEITTDDLNAALDETNTLMEVQGALQDASQGYLFLPWNGSLTEPWQD